MSVCIYTHTNVLIHCAITICGLHSLTSCSLMPKGDCHPLRASAAIPFGSSGESEEANSGIKCYI